MPDDSNKRTFASRSEEILSKVDNIRKQSTGAASIYDRSAKLDKAKGKTTLNKRQGLLDRLKSDESPVKSTESKALTSTLKPAGKKSLPKRINLHY